MAVSIPASRLTFGVNRRVDALDTGWISLPGPYLLYAKKGTLHLEIGERRWLLPPQRAAWIPLGTPLRIQAFRPIESASILFIPDSGVVFPSECCVFSVTPLAREMILHAMRWGENRLPEVAADHFFRAIAFVCVDLARQPEQLWLPIVRSALLQKAMDYILSHLATPLTLLSIANAVYTSQRTLSRKFFAETTMTLGQFIQRARMLNAMELLASSDLTVLEIVYTVGLNSVGSFETAFRKLVQESPREYRRRFDRG